MTLDPIPRRTVLAGAGLLLASRATAQEVAAQPRVAVQTDRGLIVLQLALDRAPITAANFLRYVDTGRFDRSTVYRASRAPGAPTVGPDRGRGCRTIPPDCCRPSSTRARP